MSCLYYDPAEHGVEIVDTLEGTEPYSFDIILLVRDLESGELYVARDSGCSCPVPFEDVTYPTDFSLVRTLDDVRPLLSGEGGYGSHAPAAVFDFLKRVREELGR